LFVLSEVRADLRAAESSDATTDKSDRLTNCVVVVDAAERVDVAFHGVFSLSAVELRVACIA
jgi:hypothetical protein